MLEEPYCGRERLTKLPYEAQSCGQMRRSEPHEESSDATAESFITLLCKKTNTQKNIQI